MSPSVVTYSAKLRCIETGEIMELKFTPCSPGDAGKYVNGMLRGLILSTHLDWVSHGLEEVPTQKKRWWAW